MNKVNEDQVNNKVSEELSSLAIHLLHMLATLSALELYYELTSEKES